MARRGVIRARAFGLLALIALVPLLLWKGSAAVADPSPRPGVVILLIEDRVSFEELMDVPAFRQVARSGGAALMATNQSYRSQTRDVYLALGAGAGPRSAIPQLLGRTLIQHGVAVCVTDVGGSFAAPAGPESLLGVPAFENCAGVLRSQAALFVVDDASLLKLDQESNRLPPAVIAGRRRTLLAQQGSRLGDVVRSFGHQDRVLLVVVTPSPSSPMNRIGDEVTPIVVSQGRPDQLLKPAGSIPALRSDTTRRDGLVSNVDIAPTVLNFFGIPIPSEMDGQPIRPAGHVDLFALHRLHLEQRRIRLPIQLAEIGFVAVLGIIGIPLLVALAVRGSLPLGVAAAMRYGALCGAAFGIVLLGGGLLPRLTWPVVIPYVVVATAALGALALAWRDRGPMGPFVFLGALGLGFMVVDALFGGRAFAVPLVGGTMFDGVRYYGLPNAFIAVLLASALFAAAALDPIPGVLVLFGAGLFAGFPHLGADVGGSITLFAAAGLWWALRTAPRRERELRNWRGWVRPGLGLLAAVLIGLGIVLLANRYFPGAPTHATRFVERAQSRFWSALSEVRHRLGVGWHMLNSVPAAYIPLVGLAMVLGLAVAGPGPIGRGLRLDPAWRVVLVTMVVAAAVAFVANDTGVAAAAPAFLYAMTAMAYAALLPAAWAHPPSPGPAVPSRKPQRVP